MYVVVRLALDGFELDSDGDVLTHQETASFERHIPGQSEIGAVDGGLGIESGACGSPGALGFTGKRGIEDNGAGHSFDGQITVDFASGGASNLDLGAFECDGWVCGHIKEVA